jgi:hypothetical protein
VGARVRCGCKYGLVGCVCVENRFLGGLYSVWLLCNMCECVDCAVRIVCYSVCVALYSTVYCVSLPYCGSTTCYTVGVWCSIV